MPENKKWDRNEYKRKIGLYTPTYPYSYNKTRQDSKSKQEKILDRAHEIRKFEIELYWKRTTYMSVIIGAIFVGFYTTNVHNKAELSLLLLFVGMIFSLGWIMINKGSRFWQENWEAHIDYLEDEIEGRLYKIVNESSFHSDAYSVSKVNLYLSKFVFFVFAYLFIDKMLKKFYTEIFTYSDKFSDLIKFSGDIWNPVLENWQNPYVIFFFIGLIISWIIFWMLIGTIWKSFWSNIKSIISKEDIEDLWKFIFSIILLSFIIFVLKTIILNNLQDVCVNIIILTISIIGIVHWSIIIPIISLHWLLFMFKTKPQSKNNPTQKFGERKFK